MADGFEALRNVKFDATDRLRWYIMSKVMDQEPITRILGAGQNVAEEDDYARADCSPRGSSGDSFTFVLEPINYYKDVLPPLEGAVEPLEDRSKVRPVAWLEIREKGAAAAVIRLTNDMKLRYAEEENYKDSEVSPELAEKLLSKLQDQFDA
jgi:hypothetical protein